MPSLIRWLTPIYFVYVVQVVAQATSGTREPLTIPLRRHLSNPSKKRAEAGVVDVQAVLQRDARRREHLFATGQEHTSNERRASWETEGLSSYYGDALYYASVKIGTPPQTVDLLVDTGSTDLYVQSSTCRTCNQSLIQPYFDGSQSSFDGSRSSSFEQLAAQVSLSYADGSVISGGVARDTVSLGKNHSRLPCAPQLTRPGSYTVPNQTFILATSAQLNLGVAGIIGLAFPALARTNATPWWLNALDQFAEPEISFFLTQWTDHTGTDLILPGGQLTLGGRNTSLYEESQMTFTPILSERWWTIPIASMVVTGTTRTNTTLTFAGAFTSAVIDTGTTLLYGPPEIVTAFYAAIPGARLVSSFAPVLQLDGFYALPCNATARAIIQFTETSQLTLPATNLMWLGLAQYLPGYCVCSFVATTTLNNFSKRFIPDVRPAPKSEDDTISTAPAATNQPSWLIGDAFLKSVYTVFRKGNGTAQDPPSVGFAPIKGVDYTADGNAVIGLGGNGINGAVGNAGVVVPGGSDGVTSRSASASTAASFITTTAVASQSTSDGVATRALGAWVGWTIAAVGAVVYS